MTSISYKIMDVAFWLLHTNKILNKEGEKLDKVVRFFEKMQTNKVPEKFLKGKCDYSIKYFNGNPCVIARKKASKPKRALMLFFGGGYFMPPDGGDYANIVEIANKTDTEVWFPLYPLAPKTKMSGTINMVLEVYKSILKEYPANKIIMQGNSSGASFGLFLCMYIKKEKLDIPYPKHLIMLSPGMELPPSKKQLIKMEKLQKTDYMIPIRFCKDISRILLDEKTDYLFQPFNMDWTNFPDMDVYYGDHELFYAYAEDVVEAARKASVNLKMHIGKGMMHCWPQLSKTVEGKESRKEIFNIIKSI